MATTNDEIATELLPLLRVYKSGRVKRLLGSPIVPPSPQGDPQTGVSSKDITIKSPSISARLYLPTTTTAALYFHGGGFCVESAFLLDPLPLPLPPLRPSLRPHRLRRLPPHPRTPSPCRLPRLLGGPPMAPFPLSPGNPNKL